MVRNFRSAAGVALASLVYAAVAVAAEAVPEAVAKVEMAPPPDVPLPTQFVTNHAGQFNGKELTYQVVAGETYLRDTQGEPKAAVFAFTYLVDDTTASQRPVTFVWNGGPGSASTWLHMGAFGPKRIVVPTDAQHPGPPPYQIEAAPETILDVTDLVYVDPVGTGFSRALGAHEPKEFWGLPEDPQSIAEFIRAWLTEHKRWNSPRFILGESYGTTRAAAVADILEDDMSISLNGVVFVSQALDYQGSTPYARDNLISSVTYLPTLAATAWYHERVTVKEQTLEAFLDAARAFAVDNYLPLLFKGSTRSDADYASVRERLAYFTGISETYLDQVNLRLRGDRFAKELLRDQGLAVGRLDSRYVQDDIDDVATATEGDAAGTAIGPAYKAAFMTYLLNDLGVDWTRPYLSPADPNLSDQWDWNPTKDAGWEPRYVNTAHDLAKAMRRNPRLELFVASGYYDLVTPFFDAEYTLNRHEIDSSRVQFEYYPGGHMMYVHEPSRTRLLKDTRRFIRRLLGP